MAWTSPGPPTKQPTFLASSTQVHLARLETEAGYDYVTIRDGGGNFIQQVQRHPDGCWSALVPGRIVQVQLTSDNSSTTGWGFCVDQIASGGPVTATPTPTPARAWRVATPLHGLDQNLDSSFNPTLGDTLVRS